MAKRRLAMCGCEGLNVVLWTHASGEESGVMVTGLVTGDEVVFEYVERDTKESKLIVLEDGFTPVNGASIARYRVAKTKCEAQAPITVEIILNGNQEPKPSQ